MQVKRINTRTGQVTLIEELEVPEVTPPARLRRNYEEAVQEFIDNKARTRGYDSALSCVSYYNSTISQWKAEAVAFSAWRDDVWTYVLDTMDKVHRGEIERPTMQEFRQNLPKLVWP